ncbi:MAG: adenylate kinase [Chloroflexi bacterium]|nr:adenylate kinase [Chloroflexota bacterium]
MGLQPRDDVVLLLGAPGSGKGTQARFLADTLGIPHIASGDLLRDHRGRGTALGHAAQTYMDRGDLVPDSLVVDMICARMNEPDACRGALLDGFPRTVAQDQALGDRLAVRGSGVRAAIYFEVPLEVLIDRLAGRWLCRRCQASYHEVYRQPERNGTCDRCQGELYQRSDDKREVVANRVSVYLRDTLPVVERYEQRGLLRRIDGDRPIEVVRDALRSALELHAEVAA